MTIMQRTKRMEAVENVKNSLHYRSLEKEIKAIQRTAADIAIKGDTKMAMELMEEADRLNDELREMIDRA